MDRPSIEHPKRNSGTSFRKIGDEGGLVVIPGRAEVKVLNPVAIHVYNLLDGGHTVDDIVASVVGEFEIGVDDARRDVEAFLGELSAQGMLEPVSSSPETR